MKSNPVSSKALTVTRRNIRCIRRYDFLFRGANVILGSAAMFYCLVIDFSPIVRVTIFAASAVCMVGGFYLAGLRSVVTLDRKGRMASRTNFLLWTVARRIAEIPRKKPLGVRQSTHITHYVDFYRVEVADRTGAYVLFGVFRTKREAESVSQTISDWWTGANNN